MPGYKIIICIGPPGYADTDEENIQVENEDDLGAAVRKACRYYSHIRLVHVFRDDGNTMTPVNARALHVIMEALKELVFNHRFTINKMRTNINDDVGYFGPKKKPFLNKGVYSNTA